MLTQKLLRFWPLSKNHRFISHSSRLFDSKNTDSTGKSTASTSIKNNTSEETMSIYLQFIVINIIIFNYQCHFNLIEFHLFS